MNSPSHFIPTLSTFARFLVNEDSGEISLAQKLDFEQRNVYRLAFTATDSGGRSSSTSLRIEVLDFNDRGPVFDRDEYKAVADETGTVLQPNITVKVSNIIIMLSPKEMEPSSPDS